MTELCGPNACGTCPLLGMCGDPTDLPPEPLSEERPLVDKAADRIAKWDAAWSQVFAVAERPEHAACRTRTDIEDYAVLGRVMRAAIDERPDVDPNEPAPEGGGCCGGNCCS